MTVTQTAWQGGMARVDATGTLVPPGAIAPAASAAGDLVDVLMLA